MELQTPDFFLRTTNYRHPTFFDGLRRFGPVGCKKCNDGYKGRLGIFQVLPINEALDRLILDGGNAQQIAEQAERDGIPDLRKAGLIKVKGGLTSLEEINRVTVE